jgi:hypothetical protein
MGKYDELFSDILSGRDNQSIRFTDLTDLLLDMGFKEQIKRRNRIYYRQDIEEFFNLKPKGSQAKAYQVRQIRTVILKYHLEKPNE